MIAAQKDFAPGQLCDKLQVLHTFVEIAAPAVIADEHEGVRVADDRGAVLPETFFVVFPDLFRQLSRRLEQGLEMQMQVSYRVTAHISFTLERIGIRHLISENAVMGDAGPSVPVHMDGSAEEPGSALAGIAPVGVRVDDLAVEEAPGAPAGIVAVGVIMDHIVAERAAL
jgi:hypothetical protein